MDAEMDERGRKRASGIETSLGCQCTTYVQMIALRDDETTTIMDDEEEIVFKQEEKEFNKERKKNLTSH
ncbi:hypothetical protein T4D_8601 [Trichinella pseudospiralis]|uniref:Uncharacterized protein n=1 Tax=Trichinella pseudospiralis TaxID=6337 RepID=A0A0V1FHV1_TRIPS|nr:hypothetical protein T4D_8601 [Trichinella pseudospiralis]